jgi:UBX domain-containing protein 1/4
VGPFGSSLFLSELETWMIKCRSEEQLHVPLPPAATSTAEEEKRDERAGPERDMIMEEEEEKNGDQMDIEAEKEEEKTETEFGGEALDGESEETIEARRLKFHEKLSEVKRKRGMKEKEEEKNLELRRREEGKERRDAQKSVRETQRRLAQGKRTKERERKKEERERLKRLLEEDRKEREAESASGSGGGGGGGTSVGSRSSGGGEFQSDTARSSSSGGQRSSALRFRFPDGSSLKHVFERSDVLGTVVAFLDLDERVSPGEYVLAQAYPKRTFAKEDMGSTLKELGFVPSGSLLVIQSSEGSSSSAPGYGVEATPADRSIIGQGFNWVRSTGSRAWCMLSFPIHPRCD